MKDRRKLGNMEEKSLVECLETATLSSFHYILLAICSMAYALTGMDVMLIGALLKPIALDWGLDPVMAGLLASAGYVGMFFGAIGCGFLADIVGRKRALLFTIVIFSLFTGLCAVAWDVPSMAVFRFLGGIGLGGALPQPGVYISEYISAKYRGRFLGFTESAWVYGALLAMFFGWLNAALKLGWRLTFLTAFIPFVLVPLIIWFVPESIRYLESKGKREEAVDILKKHGLPTPLESGARSSREASRGSEVTVSMGVALRELWSPFYRSRTAALWILWAVLVYTYHGIFVWLPTIYASPPMNLELVKALWFTLIVTACQIPGYYSATFLLDSLGRKPVLIGYLALAGIGSYLLGFAGDVPSILLWSCVISFFNLGAWAGLYTYTPELYPTRMRGTGSGFAASLGRFAGIFAPTITPLLWATAGLGSAFIVFALAHVAAALAVAVLGAETKGRVLEEISK